MRSQLRKIGNSRGVIIPAVLLETCELGDEVDLRLEGKTLVIEALKIPRIGWFNGYQAETDDDILAALPVDDSNGDWQW
ncbi:MAG: AbrB/MazE/SpoVT family DNA-binding domain-containing protein [Methylomonas sp.]|nr:AbrB/MazE/SpoVT family DNA-binding domain-containing protein [Methylomonas sp.]PPD19415.1 MAG: AbrB family transcriptional regulator [Methylomonas sp.]PPD25332.1 MAG: AbrB family transcriptional regulator [Methylomonas sp.]PPD35297.1 MAG: AbrB family transcriptional regulator [Methylomonas sp.]PPD51421.1 MAG: AbrB family transcriptional regulator [Methylomonas sp.]